MYEQEILHRVPKIDDLVYVNTQKSSTYNVKEDWVVGTVVGIGHDKTKALVKSETTLASYPVISIMFATNNPNDGKDIVHE